tara:strand:+ start:107 stop:484 length:378 start_codon:yes stop_codon:yes gene_type:complete
MEARDIKKLYYSISEVSEITNLKQYVLRYWETEFPQIKPTKNRAGNRNYRSTDVDIILKIKSLLYDRKFTIKGAKQYLKIPPNTSHQATFNKKIVKLTNSVDLQTLKKMKSGLDELIILVEQFKD